ncbi:putative ferric-chelate reductase 1 [Mercenaria mercenaria]|uniref:putative ferric-chelate reductase 1 n=1 Tax=Mercenaria mercenaria TaxID=6596 RepID=UPI00234E828F|nr:putative ferric-chelate reductase 1 [Mercenaria mercenaria]
MTSQLFRLVNRMTVHGYPTGPPRETCLTMFPKHDGHQRQTTPCPFLLTVNTYRYSPSETLQLTVSGMLSGQRLKGIQIRARPKYGDIERVVGQFVEWPTNKTQAYDCFGGKNNMITHSNDISVSSIEMKWTAPNVSVGDIKFVITYVENFTAFWVNEIVELSASVPVTETPIEQLSLTFEVIDWFECGRTKGCFLYPRTCSGRDCYAGVTYKVINDSVEFEMFGSQEGYVAVGFSDDKQMGDDETITCTTGEVGTGIQRGYNHLKHDNEQQFKHDLFDIQGTYKDGRLYCRFKRPLSMFVYIGEGHKSRKHYDLSDNYYLMLAWGPMYEGTDVISKHIELPPVSDVKVNFQESVVVRGSSLPIAKQIHGVFMLVGWMWLICTATIIARYFKDGFNNRIICGSKVWFQIHRALAIITWLLTVASFVLIFVVVDKLKTKSDSHSFLGITVTGASTLQLLTGILRPNPDSKLRKIFYWGHWFLGKSTVILAAVTCFFAFNNRIIPQPQKYFANIVLGVFMGMQVFWEVWFEINRILKLRKISESCEFKDMSRIVNEPSTRRKTMNGYVNPKSATSKQDISLILYIICIMTLSASALAAVFLF